MAGDLADRLALVGVGVIALGIIAAMLTPRPDILVASDGQTIAIRSTDGTLTFPRKPKDNFAASRWLARDGDDRPVKQAIGGARCDGEGCVTKMADGQLIAMPFRVEALAQDCDNAAILIAAKKPVTNCKGPKLILDSEMIARDGGYAVTNIKAVSVRCQTRGKRPWSQQQ